MMMFLIISIIISAIITNFILFDFMDLFFERSYDKNYTVILLIMSLIMAIINFFGLILLNYIWSLILLVILTKILYKSTSKNIYILTFLFFIILIVIETVVAVVFDIILPNSNLKYNFRMILSAFVLLIFQIVLRKYFSYKFSLNLKFIDFIDCILIIFSFITVFMIYFVLQEVTTLNVKFFLFFISVGLLFLDIYILHFLQEKEKYNELKNQIEMMQLKQTSDINYYNLEHKQFEEYKRFIHDLKNHLMIIENLYKKNDFERAKEYSEELIFRFTKIKRFSSDQILQIILTDIFEKCEKNNITFNCMIDPRIDLSIYNEMDIVTILSNVLNNAYEANESDLIKKKEVNLRMNIVNNFLKIELLNPYNDIKFERGKYKTTKGNHFGIGLSNVKKTVDELNGILEIKHNDNIFKILILLPYYD